MYFEVIKYLFEISIGIELKIRIKRNFLRYKKY